MSAQIGPAGNDYGDDPVIISGKELRELRDALAAAEAALKVERERADMLKRGNDVLSVLYLQARKPVSAEASWNQWYRDLQHALAMVDRALATNPTPPISEPQEEA